MNSVELSVIMPVFNSEAYLKDAIESILNQTFKNFEYMIINDGSTDNSLQIINQFNDQRIKVINQKNKGIIASLNKGITNTKGQFIARMDADDISLPNRFEEQLKLMKSQNIDVCGGNYIAINKKGDFIKSYLCPRGHEMCSLSLMSKVPFAHPSVMLRRQFLLDNNLKYGQSNFKKAEDLDLWIRIHQNGGKFSNVDKTILKYRIIKNSLSKKNDFEIKRETKSLIKRFYTYNKGYIDKILIKKKESLNNEEESIIVRALFKIYFKYHESVNFSLLKGLKKRIIIKTVLSEIKNY